MRALDVAAPSRTVDPLAPWLAPFTPSEKALATSFWASFHGLSAFAHAVAIFLAIGGTLLPIPLLMSMCALPQPIEKLPERVEVALVSTPKPAEPPPPELGLVLGVGDGVAVRTCHVDADCRADERCVNDVCVTSDEPKKKPTKKKRKKPEDLGAIAMLSIVGRLEDEPTMIGGLIGNSIGDASVDFVSGGEVGSAFGAPGGLGMRGDGSGGGGASIGVGTISIGGGTGVVHGRGSPSAALTLDGATPAVRRRLERVLRACGTEGGEVHGIVHSVDGRVVSVSTEPNNWCVERHMRAATGLPSGDEAFVVSWPATDSP